MSNFIKDGTGKSYLAQVDSENRLRTNAISRNISGNSSLLGNSYNINTGVINLTSANKTAVVYVKNTGTDKIIVENLFYLIGNSTGGSGDMLITVLRNPTAGTIVDTATPVEMNVNRNFGSSQTLTANAYKGVEAATFTDGDKVIESIFNQSATRAALNVGTIVLTQGTSIGIEITPATGNTSLDVEFALAVHVE
jgi:hypothetical protein